MLVHGVLHLIGHEHNSLKKYKKMSSLEKKSLEIFKTKDVKKKYFFYLYFSIIIRFFI